MRTFPAWLDMGDMPYMDNDEDEDDANGDGGGEASGSGSASSNAPDASSGPGAVHRAMAVLLGIGAIVLKT